MPRRPQSDLPQNWQIVSATVRARDALDRVDQVYKLLLATGDGRLIGKYARHPRVSAAAIGPNGTKGQTDAGSHIRASLH
jgi:hypothetical protein